MKLILHKINKAILDYTNLNQNKTKGNLILALISKNKHSKDKNLKKSFHGFLLLFLVPILDCYVIF